MRSCKEPCKEERATPEQLAAAEEVPAPIKASEAAKEQGLGISAEEKRRAEEARAAKAKAEKQAAEVGGAGG